jgi:predicted hotdog family 3-hydroxylacyl-ACP dehydratase
MQQPSDDARKYSLEQLLPHRGEMLLLDKVLAVNGNRAVTVSAVARGWPTAGEEGVSAIVGVELAAQTAAVCNGWDRIQHRGLDSDKMGWLVGVKKAEFFLDPYPFGLEITTIAENTLAFDSFREVASELRANDEIVARVILQLYQV